MADLIELAERVERVIDEAIAAYNFVWNTPPETIDASNVEVTRRLAMRAALFVALSEKDR